MVLLVVGGICTGLPVSVETGGGDDGPSASAAKIGGEWSMTCCKTNVGGPFTPDVAYLQSQYFRWEDCWIFIGKSL